MMGKPENTQLNSLPKIKYLNQHMQFCITDPKTLLDNTVQLKYYANDMI